MAKFRLSGPLVVPLMLLAPTVKKVKGVEKKTFPAIKNGVLFFGTFRTFGGRDQDVNGVYSVVNTATVETFYRPDVTSECRIGVPATGAVFEIVGEPENVEMRNQYLVIKLKEVKGGV